MKTHLKIKLKTLAAEGRIIKLEEDKLVKRGRGGSEAYDALYRHRIDIVRAVARTNHLAYGFLRGRTYAQMEEKTHKAPDFKEIEKIARRFSPTWDEAAWKSWLDEAMTHLKIMAEAQKAAA